MWILEKIRKVPLAPVLRGEGSGVRDQKTRKKSPPHPNPSPPEYRGRGAFGTAVSSLHVSAPWRSSHRVGSLNRRFAQSRSDSVDGSKEV